MRKRTLLILWPTVCLIVLIVFGAYQRYEVKRLEMLKDSLQVQLKYANSTIANYRDIMGYSWNSQNKRVKTNAITLIYQGKKVPFTDVVRKAKRVFVNLSTDNCWPCARYLLGYISKHKQKIELKYIIHYYTEDMLRAFLLYLNIKEKPYLIKDLQYFPIEDSSSPYLFMVTEDEHLSNVLKPPRGDSDLLNTYFSNINN